MPSQLFSVVPDKRYIVLQLQVPTMDVDACDEMQTLLEEQLDQRCQSVILDLSRAKFLPSLAIGALVAAKKKLDACGSGLTIVGLTASIRHAMELSNMQKVFRMVDRLEQAAAPPMM